MINLLLAFPPAFTGFSIALIGWIGLWNDRFAPTTPRFVSSSKNISQKSHSAGCQAREMERRKEVVHRAADNVPNSREVQALQVQAV